MGTFSIWHWLIVLVVVLVLFGGGGKLSRLMADAGKGIRSFKKGLKEGEGEEGAEAEAKEDAPKAIDRETTAAASSATEEEKTKAS